MRTTQLLLTTWKETPVEAELISHKLMLRAAMIRKNAAGIYTWLPLGLRVLHKIEGIVREEMNHTGAQEILMPTIQPAELWEESGRWEIYGKELLRIRDRHERNFCFGPTHEEIITDIMRRELRSYKQLPVTFYQIQTKFRDEIRPRFGVMRGREFLMKDAYSFHIDDKSLNETYELMRKAYTKILTRLGLNFRVVDADSGNIGGDISHEFQVLADAGEDELVYTEDGSFAANIEIIKRNGKPNVKGELLKTRGIEVGHIFQLGEKYSNPMKACVLNEKGKSVTLKMGCYGMGISRIVAAAIEQNHDDQGIIWPEAMAPFRAVIIPINLHKSYRVKEAAEKLYEQLNTAGIDVLFDDRAERTGVIFADMELIGIPHQIIIGERDLDKNVVEYKHRTDKTSKEVPFEKIIQLITKR